MQKLENRDMVTGKFFRQLRLDSGLSQAAVAKKLDYTTPQFVSNWERGIAHPPRVALGTLAQLYHTKVAVMARVVRDGEKRAVDAKWAKLV